MIAFIGATDSKYIVSEVLNEQGETFDDLSDQMIRLEDLQTLMLSKEYTLSLIHI